MGLQYRKRTKGKNAWFNFSVSKKRGIGTSFSIKVNDRITCNSRGRVTVNLGNGFRYVAYRKKKKKNVTSQRSSFNRAINNFIFNPQNDFDDVKKPIPKIYKKPETKPWTRGEKWRLVFIIIAVISILQWLTT